MKPYSRDLERNMPNTISKMHRISISLQTTQMREASSSENQQEAKSRLTKIASQKNLTKKKRYQTIALIQTHNKNVTIVNR